MRKKKKGGGGGGRSKKNVAIFCQGEVGKGRKKEAGVNGEKRSALAENRSSETSGFNKSSGKWGSSDLQFPAS